DLHGSFNNRLALILRICSSSVRFHEPRISAPTAAYRAIGSRKTSSTALAFWGEPLGAGYCNKDLLLLGGSTQTETGEGFVGWATNLGALHPAAAKVTHRFLEGVWYTHPGFQGPNSKRNAYGSALPRPAS